MASFRFIKMEDSSAKADQYATGDQEILAIHLKKGTYHIKIEDTFNNASLTPYTLKVTTN